MPSVLVALELDPVEVPGIPVLTGPVVGAKVPDMSVAGALLSGVPLLGAELVPDCELVASGTAAPIMAPGTTAVFVPPGCWRSAVPVPQPKPKAPATNARATLDAIAADPNRFMLPQERAMAASNPTTSLTRSGFCIDSNLESAVRIAVEPWVVPDSAAHDPRQAGSFVRTSGAVPCRCLAIGQKTRTSAREGSNSPKTNAYLHVQARADFLDPTPRGGWVS